MQRVTPVAAGVVVAKWLERRFDWLKNVELFGHLQVEWRF